jgi:hypothetical protein
MAKGSPLSETRLLVGPHRKDGVAKAQARKAA